MKLFAESRPGISIFPAGGRIGTLICLLSCVFVAAVSAQDGPIDTRLQRAVTEFAESLEEKKVVAVGTITYSDTGIGSEFSSFLGEKLKRQLRRSSYFEVSAGDDLEKIMEQMKLSLSGIADEASAPEAGKIKAATALLDGRYFEDGRMIRVELELTDVETGVSVAGRSVTIPKSICDELDVKPGDKVRWRVDDGELRIEVVSQRNGAFEEFEPVDIGKETDAVEMEDEFGAT